MVYTITKLWFYPTIALFIRKIKGVENIHSKTPFIIITNHEKKIDPLLIVYSILRKLNKKVHFLSNAAWWFLGETICRKWAGCIPIFDSEQAYEEMKVYLKKKRIVALFPEGNFRKRTKKSFKTGAIRLAIETNTPILPIGIKSSYFPFSSTINIGKLVYLKKDGKTNEKKINSLMKHVYELKNS